MKLFKEAEIARFTPEQAESYEESLKHLRDYTNTIETAKEMAYDEGKLEGKLEGKMEVAQQLLSTGFTFDLIQKITGLSKSQLEQLKN